MARFRIEGGHPLLGELEVRGAKNAALPILAATVLAPERSVVVDVPDLRDIQVMIEILKALGARVEVGRVDGLRSLAVELPEVLDWELPEGLTRKMRSSIFLAGPLLARCGRVRFSYPGGCAIGPRPINYHLQALKAMGAEVVEQGGYVEAVAERLRGAEIHFDQPSVGATENALMAATLAQGVTRLYNVAKEPEIRDLAGFLEEMGARIEGAGTDVITVHGVEALHGATHRVIPDRIEAGTFLVAAAMTQGDVRLLGARADHLAAALAKLAEAGAQVESGEGWIRCRGPRRPQAVDIRTAPYPGFPTDLQSPFLVMATLAEGTSVITESIFENRFKVAEELRRMGADITVDGRVAVVRGVAALSGAEVEAMDDLRGGASLVLAGLAAQGTTWVTGIEHVERGYERLDERLRRLGAAVERIA
ncbi:MAG: UDP-N-acetylglucosamine 1-carboxyvinyltransferase [Bacillota bacterium]|nr:UDP-N-acetylglucosamine 1-carboxyvinyltransferase [Bacillota bacterium]